MSNTASNTDLNLYIDPSDKAPEGFTKVIHSFCTKFVPNTEPIAVTPYNQYNIPQNNTSYKENK